MTDIFRLYRYALWNCVNGYSTLRRLILYALLAVNQIKRKAPGGCNVKIAVAGLRKSSESMGSRGVVNTYFKNGQLVKWNVFVIGTPVNLTFSKQ